MLSVSGIVALGLMIWYQVVFVGPFDTIIVNRLRPGVLPGC